jgi:hypothetical protein
MDYLKESFQINKIDNIQEAIKVAGEKIGWKPVSVLNNEIEFQYRKHMTPFRTKVQWTDDGIINLATNYRKKTLVDIGNYRGGNNETIKLSILREVESKKIIVDKTEKSTEKKTENQVNAISNDEIKDKKEKVNTNNNGSSQTSKVDEYTQQIEKKNEDQKKKLVTVAIVAIVVVGLYWFYTQQILCGCSNKLASSSAIFSAFVIF